MVFFSFSQPNHLQTDSNLEWESDATTTLDLASVTVTTMTNGYPVVTTLDWDVKDNWHEYDTYFIIM